MDAISLDGDAARRAVVLGGSMAGLLAARALTGTFDEVVVVDRDAVLDTTTARRGAPQAAHAHALLARGQQVLEELFTGLTDELRRLPVPIGDKGRMRWYVNGTRLAPADTGLLAVTAPRPVLEATVRARVAALPGIRFLQEHDIVGVETTPDGSTVTGVRLEDRTAPGAPVVVPAALTVDATGRGSRTPVWLEQLGYARPAEEKVHIDLAYTTRQFQLDRDPFQGDQSINPIATASHPRGAFFGEVPGGRAILSLTGMLGDHAPTDPEGFLEYARTLPAPEIHEAVAAGRPLGDAVRFRFPASVRRRYERLDRFPSGLAVVGDAVCSFNPVYGQGMTVAALEALVLRDLAARGDLDHRAFFAGVSSAVDAPWDVAAGGDLAWPGTRGRRTFQIRAVNRYVGRLQRAATRDGRVTDAYMRVAGLVEPPTSLMRPSTLARVVRHGGPLPAPVPGVAEVIPDLTRAA